MKYTDKCNKENVYVNREIDYLNIRTNSFDLSNYKKTQIYLEILRFVLLMELLTSGMFLSYATHLILFHYLLPVTNFIWAALQFIRVTKKRPRDYAIYLCVMNYVESCDISS